MGALTGEGGKEKTRVISEHGTSIADKRFTVALPEATCKGVLSIFHVVAAEEKLKREKGQCLYSRRYKIV